MTLRPISSFISTADELLTLDLARLGAILLLHLKSYEGLNTVFQNGRLNRDYFVAMTEKLILARDLLGLNSILNLPSPTCIVRASTTS